MFVTYKLLNDRFPCKDQLALFNKTYPKGIELSLLEALKALDLGLDVTWLCVYLDKTGTNSQQEFLKACTTRIANIKLSDPKNTTKDIEEATLVSDKTKPLPVAIVKNTFSLKADYEARWAEMGEVANSPTKAALSAARAVKFKTLSQVADPSKAESVGLDAEKNEVIEQLKILVPMLLKKYPPKSEPIKDPLDEGESVK